jgi:uncharacterized protein YidB (DUF937 family)
MSLIDQISGLFKGGKSQNLLSGITQMISSGDISMSKFLDNFNKAGMGDKVQSWIGTGENQSISPEEIKQAAPNLPELADKAGVSVDEAAEQLSKTLPEMVNKLSPDGVLPDDEQLKSAVSNIT